MTEQVQATEIQNQPNSSVIPNAPAVAGAQAPAERMLKQSEVNEIVGRYKNEAYQKGKSDALAEFQTHQTNVQPQPQATQHVGGIAQQTPEEIRKMIIEENQKIQFQNNYQQLANTFVSKLEAGKGKYQDFEQVVTPLNLPQIPLIWQTATAFDNPADIVYELGKNPSKLAQLASLGYSPELVKREMQKLSDSLKQNDLADEQKVPNAPLRRPQPSNTGMGNGGNKELNAQDWKKILRT